MEYFELAKIFINATGNTLSRLLVYLNWSKKGQWKSRKIVITHRYTSRRLRFLLLSFLSDTVNIRILNYCLRRCQRNLKWYVVSKCWISRCRRFNLTIRKLCTYLNPDQKSSAVIILNNICTTYVCSCLMMARAMVSHPIDMIHRPPDSFLSGTFPLYW